MCGITGVLGASDRQLISKMLGHIAYRGPDGKGLFDSDNATLAHCRLAIIDTNKRANQPMLDSEGNICIVYNGEIYNYKELRSDLEKKGYRFRTTSDTEVLLNLYKELGPECLKLLNGIFAFVIWDLKKQKGFFARDRFGVKPLYYMQQNKRLYFASELKAFIKSRAFDLKIDANSLQEYLGFGCVSGEDTIIGNLKKLLPGHYGIYSNGLVSLNSYWQPEFHEETASFKSYKYELLQTLSKATLNASIADVPIGVYLSGGLDSSTIAYFISKFTNNLKAFTVYFDDSSVVDECKFAESLTNDLNLDHHKIYVKKDVIHHLKDICYYLDEPVDNLSAIPSFIMAREARKHVKVVLSGLGGDELFGGYSQHRIFHIASKFAFTNKLNFTKFMRFKNIKLNFLKYLLENDVQNAYYVWKRMSLKGKTVDTYVQPSNFEAELVKTLASDTNTGNKMMLIDIKTILPNNYLLVDDRVNMASSLEARPPFLENNIADLAFKIPAEYKINLFSGKIINRETLKGHLPEEIIRRKKYPFTSPARYWFTKHADYVRDESLRDEFIWKFLNKPAFKNIFVNNPTNKDINFVWRTFFLSNWLDNFGDFLSWA